MPRDSKKAEISRRSLIGAVGAGSAVALGGCISTGGDDGGSGGGGSGGGGGDNAPQTGDDVEMASEITVWGFGTLPPAYESWAESYNEQTDDDVTINVESLGYNENLTQFQSAISSGQGAPDVGTAESRFTPGYIGQNGIRDFGDAIGSDTADQFVDWKWSSLSDDSGNGRYGLPLDTAPVLTFYNRQMYDDLGIAPEDISTYQDLIDAGQDLGEDEYMAAVSTNTMEWRWEMLLRQQGGQAYTEDGALNLDTEETVQAGRVVRDLFESGVVVDIEEFTESWTTAISEGRIATLTTGAWMVGALEGIFTDMSGNWGMHRPPAVTEGGNRATNHGGSNLVIPTQVDQPKANRAFDFIKHGLTNDSQVMTLVEEAGVYPAYEGVFDNGYWSEGKEFFDGQSLELIVELASEIPVMRLNSNHSDVYTRMRTWMSRAATGEVSPEEMAAQAQEDIAERTGMDTA